ncbi:hypothetical protein BDZ89DRAFT_1073555 [Hymenopellis radicata]|nr:hypothetical protein BDZ89DRAFT_1073555 [Hymenopellis radicata]
MPALTQSELSIKRHNQQSYMHEEWTMSKTQPTRSETRANEGQDVNREERPAAHENPTNEEQATTDQPGTCHD